jgi:conjugative transposon protein TcpC
MRTRASLSTRSLRATRWQARALPALLGFALLALAAVGAVSALRGAPRPPSAQPVALGADLPIWGLAEAFASDYLSWDSVRPQGQATALSAYLTDGAVSLPARGSQRVRQAHAIQARPGESAGEQVVTVLAETTDGRRYLAVPVRRRARSVEVSGYPALVGPPAMRTGGQEDAGEPVADGTLREVAVRALGNYLGRHPTDLRADLAPQALVSLPPHPLRLAEVRTVTWAQPATVAVTATVSELTGVQYTLRYALDVVRRERWYVRAIETNPGK